MNQIKRCEWCLGHDIYLDYHDNEWGNPQYDDQKLFEMINLEGAQAGLSWITILKKRENYRKAFDQFDAQKMANYGPDKIDELLNNAGIIRNKRKVNAFITNAQAYLKIKEAQSFSDYIWQFVEGKPIQNKFQSLSDIPANTEISEKMSKQLKRDGFKFVGSTICYAFMQAVGMVNDHVVDCFRYRGVGDG
jgi:DNA-3-methyladenine glycosylase I